jgi:glycosyltransferase involved in cell wall biosynthesis
LLVSVVIPTFNRPEKLQRAIRSVLAQTFEELEILVVNDSIEEDPVLGIIKDCGDPRIRYFRNQLTKGANGARNTGILCSNGVYVAFLDDDDEWLPEKIKLQVEKLERLDPELWAGCYCGYYLSFGGTWITETNLLEGSFLNNYLRGTSSVGASSNLLLRRNALLSIGGFHEGLARYQDVHFVLMYLKHYKLALVREPLSKIYGHNDPRAVTVENATETLIELLRHDDEIVREKNWEYFQAGCFRDLSILFVREGNYQKFFNYLALSLRHRIMLPHRYVKVFLAVIEFITGMNFVDRYLNTRAKILNMIAK